MEVAAGAVIAEEAVSTTVQASAVAVAIAQPTGPLKAIFNQIGSAPQSGSPDSLARSAHTITCSQGDIYIYGGFVADKALAGPEMHILKLSNVGGSGPDYKSIPPLAEHENGQTPSARAGHAVLSPLQGTFKDKLVMYGGSSTPNSLQPLDEKSQVWVFDPETMFWTALEPSNNVGPGPRVNHTLISWKNSVIIHGGKTGEAESTAASDTWQFDFDSKAWTELPALEVSVRKEAAAPPLFTVSEDKLWLVTKEADQLTTSVHCFDLAAWHASFTQSPSDMATGEESASWVTISVPTNPLTPGPTLRSGASIHTISTGMGRRYLLLMLGTSPDDFTQDDSIFHSTLWTLQLPSVVRTPAAIKDATREALPRADTHTLEWHAVDIVPKDEAPIGLQQRTWLGAARSAITTNVGGAANWVARKGSITGKAIYDLASPGSKSGPTSPTADAEAPPVLEDNEDKAAPPPAHADTASAAGDVEHVAPAPAVDDDASERSSMQTSGKAHPGPRGQFGSTVLVTPSVGAGLSGPSENGAQVLLWGGLNARGDREGDGWLIELKV